MIPPLRGSTPAERKARKKLQRGHAYTPRADNLYTQQNPFTASDFSYPISYPPALPLIPPPGATLKASSRWKRGTDKGVSDTEDRKEFGRVLEIDMFNTRKKRINEELNRLEQEKRDLHTAKAKPELTKNAVADMEEQLLVIENVITINRRELVDINRLLASNVKGGKKLSRKRTRSRKIRSRRKVKGGKKLSRKRTRSRKIRSRRKMKGGMLGRHRDANEQDKTDYAKWAALPPGVEKKELHKKITDKVIADAIKSGRNTSDVKKQQLEAQASGRRTLQEYMEAKQMLNTDRYINGKTKFPPTAIQILETKIEDTKIARTQHQTRADTLNNGTVKWKFGQDNHGEYSPSTAKETMGMHRGLAITRTRQIGEMEKELASMKKVADQKSAEAFHQNNERLRKLGRPILREEKAGNEPTQPARPDARSPTKEEIRLDKDFAAAVAQMKMDDSENKSTKIESWSALPKPD